jgi:hypothetical protein
MAVSGSQLIYRSLSSASGRKRIANVQRPASLLAAANAAHGVPRTSEDKRRALVKAS